jgi:hypothetical protein
MPALVGPPIASQSSYATKFHVHVSLVQSAAGRVLAGEWQLPLAAILLAFYYREVDIWL